MAFDLKTCYYSPKVIVSSGNYASINQAPVTRHDKKKDEAYIRLTDNTFKTDITDIETASKMRNIEMQQP